MLKSFLFDPVLRSHRLVKLDLEYPYASDDVAQEQEAKDR